LDLDPFLPRTGPASADVKEVNDLWIKKASVLVKDKNEKERKEKKLDIAVITRRYANDKTLPISIFQQNLISRWKVPEDKNKIIDVEAVKLDTDIQEEKEEKETKEIEKDNEEEDKALCQESLRIEEQETFFEPEIRV
jgi:hypothetical protein